MQLAPLNDWLEGPMRAQSNPAHYARVRDTIKQAAAVMQKYRCSAVLLRDPENSLVGIVTDKDLRHAAAMGMDPNSTPAKDIMSAPVRTFPRAISLAEAQIAMLRFAISHLVLTRDGTTDSEVVGIVEQKDILITHSQNPALLIRKIKKAADLDTLLYIAEESDQLIEEYLLSGIPLPHLARIKSALTDAVVGRVLERRLAVQEGFANHPFAWLALGSLGREEQLLRTDQDNALIYADTVPEQAAIIKRQFLELAEGVNRDLDHLGFDYCPAEMMAQNPEWCLSLSEWKQRYSHWIKASDEKGILESCIFFDYRNLTGDAKLVRELDRHILNELKSATLFIGYMAVNALKAPRARGLFGRLVREHEAEHRGLFDVKARGMMPLADAARVLCLHQGQLHPTGTTDRYTWLEKQEPQNAPLYRRCKEAYIRLMDLRLRTGITQKDSGRYLNVGNMDRTQRRELIEALKPVKSLKSLLEVRFQVSGML